MKLGRKITGGRYKKARKKKSTEKVAQRRIVKLGDKKTKTLIGRGKTKKTVSLKGNMINVLDSSNKKLKKVKITNVAQTPSNRFLARQNILTKGAIVETELGKVRITNRPSQEAVINGVLVE